MNSVVWNKHRPIRFDLIGLHQCPQGQFGADCSGLCHCLHGPDVCRSEDGRCTDSLCQPGWTNPPRCQTGTTHSFLFCVFFILLFIIKLQNNWRCFFLLLFVVAELDLYNALRKGVGQHWWAIAPPSQLAARHCSNYCAVCYWCIIG